VQQPAILARADGATIAYHHNSGHGPGVIFCGGFKSDMTGIKATMLDAFCRSRDQQFTRFDYQGHGASSGAFEDGTIGLWREDLLTVFEEVTEGPQIVVGSSMGAWMALLLTLLRRDRIAGLVLLAPAADFTTELLWKSLTPEAKQSIERDGLWMRPSIYDDGPYPITRNLIEESRAHLVLGHPIPFDGPVRILLGLRDEVIPASHVLRTADAIDSDDIEITLIKNGDHRLSTAGDLDKIRTAVDALS
jgi:pimeloyl-ACP methyl ester carboxylesterase